MTLESKFRLTGHVNPRGDYPAICVPMFSTLEDNYQYVQAVGIDHKVMAMEQFEPTEWELGYGAPPEETSIDTGDPAIYWVAPDHMPREALIGPLISIKRGLLKLRPRIAVMSNPFERLDFAQLSEDVQWYAEEAAACEEALSNGEVRGNRVQEWLKDAVLRGRICFAVETMARYNGLGATARLRLISQVDLDINEDHATINRDALRSVGGVPALGQRDLDRLQLFIDNDFVCCYALSRLFERTHENNAAMVPNLMRRHDPSAIAAPAAPPPPRSGLVAFSQRPRC
jgi:hypothetical protein